MDYPLAKVLALLAASKAAGAVDSSPAYEETLAALLNYERQEIDWQQTSHPPLPSQTADHALRSGTSSRGNRLVLDVGGSLFFLVNHPSGYTAEITLYRPLNRVQQDLKGSALLTPIALQETWIGAVALLYEEDTLIDTSAIDQSGDFTLTPLAFGQSLFHLSVRLPTGESLTLEPFIL